MVISVWGCVFNTDDILFISRLNEMTWGDKTTFGKHIIGFEFTITFNNFNSNDASWRTQTFKTWIYHTQQESESHMFEITRDNKRFKECSPVVEKSLHEAKDKIMHCKKYITDKWGGEIVPEYQYTLEEEKE